MLWRNILHIFVLLICRSAKKAMVGISSLGLPFVPLVARMCAVEALGRIGITSKPVFQALTKASFDTNSDVSAIAKMSLQSLHAGK